MSHDFTRRPKTRMTPDEIAALVPLFKEVCQSVNGEAVYAEGWNDRAVHTEMVRLFPRFERQGMGTIAQYRNKYYGVLAKPIAPELDLEGKATRQSLDRVMTFLRQQAVFNAQVVDALVGISGNAARIRDHIKGRPDATLLDGTP